MAQDSLCPIFRIEYQTPDHELERVDLELATEQYCFKNITPMGSHLSSITLYGRIEKGSLRNHHAHSFEFISEFISTQLVVLDFILEHRDIEHLEPEHDKFTFFCEQLGVSIEFLPGTLSEGGIGRRLSVCYFVDICPLFLGRYLPCSPVVTLSYPDSGIETIVGFLTHLGVYQPLFHELSSFRLLCISPKHPQSARAKERFHSVVKRPLESDVSAAPPNFRSGQEVRKLVRTASNRDFEFLNEAERRFRGERFVCMQRAWESGELNEQDLGEFCPIETDRAVFFGYVSGDNHSYLAKRSREQVNVA